MRLLAEPSSVGIELGKRLSKKMDTEKPRIPQRSRLAIDYYYDIETDGWDVFTLGCVLNVATGEWFISRNEVEFAEYILSLVGVLWAHNGGRFDMLWLCKFLRGGGLRVRIFATSARITRMRIGDKTTGFLEVRDSAAVVPLPLKDFAGFADGKKLSVGLPCQCSPDELRTRDRRSHQGGYCRIRVGMPEADYLAVEAYCLNDCKVGAAALVRLQEYADENDLDLAATVGAGAWKTLKRWMGLPNAEWEARLYRAARAGYYGGRVQVFRPRSWYGHRDDINAAYPAALCEQPVPTGPVREIAGRDAEQAFRSGVAGIYRCAVDVPPMLIPPLPFRDEEGRLRFPVGKFVGVWTELELRRAVELGVTASDFGQTLIWHEMISLKLGLERIWDLRAAVGKKHPIGKWLKYKGNAPTGKFAQHPESEEVVFSPENPEPCPGNALCHGVLCGAVGCCEHKCTGKCGTFEPVGWGQDTWIKKTYRIPPNGYVQWAAYLTSYNRVKLLNRLLLAGTSAVYCDTDSLYSERLVGGNGTELGQWQYDGPYAPFVDLNDAGKWQIVPGWECFAPKTYRFWDPVKREKIIRSKGIAEPEWNDLAAKRPSESVRGVAQFKSALRGESMFRARVIRRQLRHDGVHYGDRILGPGGMTYPTDVKGAPCYEV